MKLFTKGLLRSAMAGAISFCAVAGASTYAMSAEVTLRFHHFLPAQANVPKNIFVPWIEKIEKESEGRIKVQQYPAMQLGGKPPALYDQVVDGVADIIWTLPGYTPGRFPSTEVFELPFTMKDAEVSSRAYWQLGQEMMQEEFKDVHLLALFMHGPGVIHSKKPVKTMDDLKGLKLRAPTRITNSMFKTLGATPIGMPVPAVPSALSKGVVDGTVLPWEVTGAFKIPELVGNHTMFEGNAIYTSSFVIAMNKDSYNNLPADLKKVIDNNSGLEFSGQAGKLIQSFDQGVFEATKARGNNMITISEEEAKAWKEKSQVTIDQWIKEMDEKGKNGSALYKRAQELVAENAK